MNAKKFFCEELSFYRESEVRRILSILEQGKKFINFGGGIPDLTYFPVEKLRAALERAIERYGVGILQYAPTSGIRELREALRKLSAEELGLRIGGSDDLIVISGSQQGLDLLSRILVSPGDIVIVENPTYLAALNAFRPRKPKLFGVGIDNEGMKTEELEKLLRKLKGEGERVKFVYTVPTNNNPAGTTLSVERRKHLVELASEYDFLIIEDDPYRMITFEGTPPPPIKSYDREGRVVYISTLSKVLSPGLRLAWAVAHEDIANAMCLVKQVADIQSSTLTQYLALELLRMSVHREYLSRVLPSYKVKRDAMVEELEKRMPPHVWFTRPKGGLFVFVKLNRDVDTAALLMKALDEGVAFVPGNSFFVDGSGKDTMRLSYSYPEPEEIREGIARLSRLVTTET